MFQRTSSSYQLASEISKPSQTNKYQQLRIMTLIRKKKVITLFFELDDLNFGNANLKEV